MQSIQQKIIRSKFGVGQNPFLRSRRLHFFDGIGVASDTIGPAAQTKAIRASRFTAVACLFHGRELSRFAQFNAQSTGR